MPSDTSRAGQPAPQQRQPLRVLVAQAREIINNPSSADDKTMRSVLFLMKQGFLNDAMVGLRRLREHNAYGPRVSRMSMVAGYLLRRGWGRGFGTVDGGGKDWKIVGFTPESDVHVMRHERSKNALFVFAGVGAERRAAFDLTLLLQFLRGFDTHVFMLRDSRTLLYMDGLMGLGNGVDASAARLKEMAQDLGAERMFAIGNCGGSFASLRYGLQIGVEGVLCFAPRTDYSGGMPLPKVDADRYERLSLLVNPERRDMRPVYEQAPNRPKVEIWYGEGNEFDSAHARHFEGVPGARCIGVQGAAGRYIVPRLFRTGEFEEAVGRLLGQPVARRDAVRRRSPEQQPTS